MSIKQKLIKHITRSWEDEPGATPSRAKLLPPFIWELLAYLLGLAILYQVGAYLYSLC